MGTEWPLRLSDRLKEDGAPADLPGADEVIVVNASGGWRGARKQVSVNKPLVGEISTLMAVKDVMYDQTTSVRRRLLDRLFRVASESGGLRGTTVQIDRSPFAVADSFTDGDDDLAKRAGRAWSCSGTRIATRGTTRSRPTRAPRPRCPRSRAIAPYR